MFGRIHQLSHLILDFCLLEGFLFLIQSPYKVVFLEYPFLHHSILVGDMFLVDISDYSRI